MIANPQTKEVTALKERLRELCEARKRLLTPKINEGASITWFAECPKLATLLELLLLDAEEKAVILQMTELRKTRLGGEKLVSPFLQRLSAEPPPVNEPSLQNLLRCCLSSALWAGRDYAEAKPHQAEERKRAAIDFSKFLKNGAVPALRFLGINGRTADAYAASAAELLRKLVNGDTGAMAPLRALCLEEKLPTDAAPPAKTEAAP